MRADPLHIFSLMNLFLGLYILYEVLNFSDLFVRLDLVKNVNYIQYFSLDEFLRWFVLCVRVMDGIICDIVRRQYST